MLPSFETEIVKTSDSARKGEYGQQPESSKGSVRSTESLVTGHKVFTNWTQGTSIHGVPYTTSEDFKIWKRSFWIIVTITWAGVLLWQISEIIKEYRTYETSVNIATHVGTGFDFPEITICNQNPYLEAAVNASSVPRDDDGEPLPRSPEELVELSQPVESFLWGFFNDDIVEASAWKPLIKANGVCYQFRTDELVYRPGIIGGLALTVKLNTKSNVGTSDLTGIFVYVSQPGATETDHQPFILLGPNQYHSINLSRQRIHLERRAPWSTCMGAAPDYTQFRCQEQCESDAIVAFCGCRKLSDTSKFHRGTLLFSCDGERRKYLANCIRVPYVIGNTGTPYCENIHDCIFDMPVQNTTDCQIEKCSKPACEEVVYTTATSSFAYRENTLTEDDIAEGHLTVHINYDSMRETSLTETRLMTFSQLLGNIGGQMGLFLGISVISIMEVGELLLLRLVPRVFGERRMFGIGGLS